MFRDLCGFCNTVNYKLQRGVVSGGYKVWMLKREDEASLERVACIDWESLKNRTPVLSFIDVKRSLHLDALPKKIVWGYAEAGRFQCIKWAPSCICALVQKGAGYTEHWNLMRVKNLFFELLAEIYCRYCSGWGKFNEGLISLRTLVNELKKISICVLEKHCIIRLFTITFLLSYQLCNTGMDLEFLWA